MTTIKATPKPDTRPTTSKPATTIAYPATQIPPGGKTKRRKTKTRKTHRHRKRSIR